MDYLKKNKNDLLDDLISLKQEYKSLRKLLQGEMANRELVEEGLRLNEEKFERFANAAVELVFFIDKTGHCIFFDDRLESVLGYTTEEAVGRPFTKFVPVGEIPRYLVSLKKIFQNKEIIDFNTRIFHKDGRLVDVEISGKLTRFDGEPAIKARLRDISERVRVQNALNESLKSYKGLFDSVSEAIYIHKEDGVFIDVNAGATSMYGYSRNELIGMTPELVSAPGMNNLEELSVLMQKTMRTGIPEQFEFWGRRKNGEIFPKEVICHKGKYFGEDVIISTARDITERKASEQALRESESKYRILAEKMHDVVWILDLDLKLVYVSPSTEFTLGFTPGERMTMRIDECMVPESLDYAMQVLINEAVNSHEDMAEKDRGVLLELEYYHKDGTTRWLEQSINGIYDEHGELSGIMGVARDITERKMAKDAMRESAESYHGLFNSVTDAIYVLDQHGKFIDVNEGAVKMYGYPHDVLVGKDPFFVSAPGKNDMESVGEMLKLAYSGMQQQFEFWGKRSNGEHFLKDVRLQTGIYFGQKVIVAIAHDITARRNNEMALKSKVDELESMNRRMILEDDQLTRLKQEVNELLSRLGEHAKYQNP